MWTSRYIRKCKGQMLASASGQCLPVEDGLSLNTVLGRKVTKKTYDLILVEGQVTW